MSIITFRSWPDEGDGRVYTKSRGWWIRLGETGPGIHYRNISRGGYNPLFKERYGLDRTIALRFGSHLFKLLRRRRAVV